jgi:flagella basal body P-ring formation protein FlgA
MRPNSAALSRQFRACGGPQRPTLDAVDKCLLPPSVKPSWAARAAALGLALALPAAAQSQAPDGLQDAAALIGQAAKNLQRPGARVEVTLGQLDPRLRLAPCARTEAYLPPGQRAIGRTRVGLRCVEGPTRWNITVPVTVALFAPAWVLTETLPAGTRLQAHHFMMGEIDHGSLTGTARLPDPETLLGRELVRPLSSGSPVASQDVRQRQWFAAGETVQVIARGAGFAVSTDGEALSAGTEGSPVRVRTASGRIISGRAVGDRQVEVML